MIEPGMSAESRMTVTEKDTAEAWGSGTLPVLATPRMILMIEETAMKCIAEELGEKTSVGTLVDVAHVSASPIGSEVFCKVEVAEVDRARVRFKVRVYDRDGDVGTGFHERFAVDPGKFMQKAESKLRSPVPHHSRKDRDDDADRRSDQHHGYEPLQEDIRGEIPDRDPIGSGTDREDHRHQGRSDGAAHVEGLVD